MEKNTPLGLINSLIRIFLGQQLHTFPKTNMFAPENGWLEDETSFLGWPMFRGELLVSGRGLADSDCEIPGLFFSLFVGLTADDTLQMLFVFVFA